MNRSSLYYAPRPVTPEEISIKHVIDEIYTAYPFYGSRRIRVALRESHKLVVARETVQRRFDVSQRGANQQFQM